jgi:hypothetical protein
MRYYRLVPKLITVDPEDMQLLKDALEAVEEEMKEEMKALQKKKWARVAGEVAKLGGGEYPADTLEKAWKTKANSVPSVEK